jgi:hypothetical protein
VFSGHIEQDRDVRHALAQPVMQAEGRLEHLGQFFDERAHGLLTPIVLQPIIWIAALRRQCSQGLNVMR